MLVRITNLYYVQVLFSNIYKMFFRSCKKTTLQLMFLSIERRMNTRGTLRNNIMQFCTTYIEIEFNI